MPALFPSPGSPNPADPAATPPAGLFGALTAPPVAQVLSSPADPGFTQPVTTPAPAGFNPALFTRAEGASPQTPLPDDTFKQEFQRWADRDPILSADGSTVIGQGTPRFPLPEVAEERKNEVARGRGGRYILPDVTNPHVRTEYARATTIKGYLSTPNTSLTDWKIRNVVKGLLTNPALADQIDTSLFGTDQEFKLKGPIRTLADTCASAVGADDAREFGTAIHAWSEEVDHHRCTIADVPDIIRPYVAAYFVTLRRAGLAAPPEYIERVVYCPVSNSAGTVDRIFRMGDGSLVIGDIKTSSNIDFSWLDMAVQLAQYANADRMYDPVSGQYEAMPPVRTDIGVIAHMPAIPKDGADINCALYVIDLRVGLRALETATASMKLANSARTTIPLGSPTVLPMSADAAVVEATALTANGWVTSAPAPAPVAPPAFGAAAPAPAPVAPPAFGASGVWDAFCRPLTPAEAGAVAVEQARTDADNARPEVEAALHAALAPSAPAGGVDFGALLGSIPAPVVVMPPEEQARARINAVTDAATVGDALTAIYTEFAAVWTPELTQYGLDHAARISGG